MGNEIQKAEQSLASANQTKDRLSENFKRFAGQNGELSLDQFIQALTSMDEFRELANSPVSSRLFHIFDTDGTGQISQQEYLEGIQKTLKNDESKIEYTFKVFARNNSVASLRDFTDLFQEAWLKAFTLLEDALLKKTQHGSNPNLYKVKEWAMKNTQIVTDKVAEDFRKYTQNDV